MRRYSKAQLNAISRSYTEKAQRDATKELSAMGINYETYCEKFSYKASPVKLLTAIKQAKATTVANVNKLMETEKEV